jgi:hypothetical protein
VISQNAKARAAGVRTFNFGIPAFRHGRTVTCPNAGLCAASCYARSGAYNFPDPRRVYAERLAATRSPSFVADMTAAIERKKPRAFRWNDSGDWYSREYLTRAFEVMRRTPAVQHYCYSKQVELLKDARADWPENLTVIFSLGGKQDHLVDLATDRHAQVFDSVQELYFARYANASIDDSVAWRSKSHRIGLVYHGQKKNSFPSLNSKTKKKG